MYQCVCIQEDALAEPSELPCVELGEGDSQVGSLEQGQVLGVFAVDQVHVNHLVEDASEDLTADRNQNSKHFKVYSIY